jgi:hypothetical protein
VFHFFGYIDPGTGSLFLQAIVGGLLGGMFIFRRFIAKIIFGMRKVFKRDARRQETSEE